MTTTSIQIAASQGLMRLDIDGDWTMRDLWVLFMSLHHAYERASIIAFLAEQPSEALAAAGSQPELLDRADLIRQGYDPVEIAAVHETAPLTLKRMRYGSPGWVEAIGSLLPLQVILNFILKIREQNAERERQQMAFQLELLDRIPAPLRKVYAANLLAETMEFTEPLAENERVKSVSVSELTE